MSEPVQLKPTSTDAEGAEVVLKLEDGSAGLYEARLPTMAAMSMLGALTHSLEEAGKRPIPGQFSIELDHLQLAEVGEWLMIRMFVSREVSHEYRLARRTDLAEALIQAVEALHLSKVTHPGSDKPQ